MMSDTVRAIILGIVEGVTEFLPVSSTGHLLLAERFFDLGEGEFWKSFAILIRLARSRRSTLLHEAVEHRAQHVQRSRGAALRDRRADAFLPAVVLGLIAGKYIKGYLFNPWVVCSPIVGGAILLWVDQLDLEVREDDATRRC
jgi:undecaprenyl-diphosphatase